MKVKVTDTNKVIDALNAGQGRATSRTLNVSDIVSLAVYGEKRLEELGLPKKIRSGATVHYSPESVANSYKWRAEGSFATLTRGSTHWYVTDVHRGQCGSQPYGGSSHRGIELTPGQQIQLINNHPLYGDVIALPYAAIDNRLRWALRQDPQLIETLRVVQVTKEEIAPLNAA